MQASTRKTYLLAVFALGLVVVLAGTALAQSAQPASPLSGTWKLNMAKSTYSPSTLAPKSGTTQFDVTKDGVKAVVDGVDSQGRATHQEYTATFDGKDHPWKGTIAGQPSPNQDAIAWKKIDDHTYEITNKLKGQTLTSSRIVVAKDGRSRTNTTSGKNAQGVTVNVVAVYDKQ
jgi:hypothetical protein